MKMGRKRRAGEAAFVLVEVLMSLTILGIATVAFMQSFGYSLKAAKKMEIITQATFFATQLLDELEINPPAEGETEGGFGDDYANYYYRLKVEYEEPRYRNIEPPDDIEQMFALRRIGVSIFYDDGRRKEPFLAAQVETALMGFEKFSSQSKMSYLNY